MTVVKRLYARTLEELAVISWRMHDADFDPRTLVFDSDGGVVEMEFEQEPRDLAVGIPASAFVRSTTLFNEYAVPFLRHRCIFEAARGLSVPKDVTEDGRGLLSAQFDAKTSTIRIATHWGSMQIPVVQLRVTLEITDEIVEIRRRRVGKALLRWDSTSRWPRDQQGRVKDRVLRAARGAGPSRGIGDRATARVAAGAVAAILEPAMRPLRRTLAIRPAPKCQRPMLEIPPGEVQSAG